MRFAIVVILFVIRSSSPAFTSSSSSSYSFKSFDEDDEDDEDKFNHKSNPKWGLCDYHHVLHYLSNLVIVPKAPLDEVRSTSSRGVRGSQAYNGDIS
jgi:hypothetical protein